MDSSEDSGSLERGLKHALHCTTKDCDASSCEYLKPLMAHVKHCPNRRGGVRSSKEDDVESKTEEEQVPASSGVNGTCSTCIEYWDIVKLHAKTCRDPVCEIDNCHLLRPSSMRRMLMTKATSNPGSSMADMESVATSVADSKGGSMFLAGGSFNNLTSPPVRNRSVAKPYQARPKRLDSDGEDGELEELTRTSSWLRPKVQQNAAADTKGAQSKKGDSISMENPLMYAGDTTEEKMGQLPRRRSWRWSCASSGF